MASWAPSAAEVAAPRARPQGRSRAHSRPRVAGGALWIAFSAILLAGVVFLNVAVLRLNLQMDQYGRERTKLRAESAALASQLSSASDSLKIEAQARRQLGLEPAAADQINYLDLAK
jgi:cell division protein FtsL